nr:LUD domain-containing protein [Actinomycetota bacterium]
MHILERERTRRVDRALLDTLGGRNFDPRVVSGADEALQLVLSLLPDGALVSHGGSTTLEQIGLESALATSSRVRYGNAEWLAEDDSELRTSIRKRNSVFADVYLGSVQAIARTGQVVGADAGGSRQGPYVWGPNRLI